MLLGRNERATMVAMACMFGAAVVAVLVFFPSDGRVFGPLHGIVDLLLGHVSFVLPLGLALAAALGFVLSARPKANLPKKRLAGLALITIALLPADSLLGQSTGVVGDWFTGSLVSAVGGPLTVALTVLMLVAGSALTFDVRRRGRAAR